MRDPRHGPALAFNVAPDGAILYVHRSFVAAPADVLCGTSIFEHTAPDQRDRFRTLLAQVLATAQSVDYECRGFLPFAPDAWYRCRIAPNTFAGTAVSATVIMHDVTRWKRAEDELQRERERLLAQVEWLSAEKERLGRLSADVASLTATLRKRDEEREQEQARRERDQQLIEQLSEEVARLAGALAERDRERGQHELDQIKERLAAAATIAQHATRWRHAEARLSEEPAQHAAELARLSDELAKQTYWLDRRDRELHRSRAILDQTDEAILLIDPGTGRFVDANETACRWLGESRERLLSITTGDVDLQFPTDVSDDLAAHAVDTRKAGRAQLLRSGVVRRRNGTTFPVEVALACLRIGERDYTLVVARDAGARERVEQALLESEEKFRSLLALSRDAIYLSARDGTIADVNAAASELFGYTREEFLGLPAKNLYRRAEEIRAFQRAVAEHGSVREMPVELRTKEGATVQGLLTATLRHAGDGAVSGYQCIIRPLSPDQRGSG